MNTIFKIPHTKSDTAATNLIIEIGGSNIAIFCYATFPFTANGFYYYTILESDTKISIAMELQNIFASENLSAANVDAVHIFYNNAESTLVPTAYFKKEEINNIASLIFGNKTNYTNLHETLQIGNIENVYAVQVEIKNVLDTIFPTSKSMHSLSKAVQNTNGTKLFATIYDKEIRLILFKENNFTLATYFEYTTPEDVCYHMLNVCERYNVNASEVELVINGMIDTNSNLYKEIYKFFIQITIENLPEKVQLSEGFDGIAAHYFSPLVKLAKCVS